MCLDESVRELMLSSLVEELWADLTVRRKAGHYQQKIAMAMSLGREAFESELTVSRTTSGSRLCVGWRAKKDSLAQRCLG